MRNATGFYVNMMSQPDAKLRGLTDDDYRKLANFYFDNIAWLKFCVTRWLQRSGR